MLVIPAIDLKDGKAVRLYKGDYNQKTIYSDNPSQVAKQFESMNATYLHVVDLDGAKDGTCKNLETIQKIKESTTLKVQLGGGIRDEKTVQLFLEQVGIDRVILGTAALKNPTFLQIVLDRYGSERIVVGVDVKNGFVSTAGWLETSEVPYLTFIKKLYDMGIRYIVVTDISKDGTLMGPNFAMYEEIANTCPIHFVVSGGVKDSEDIKMVASKGYYACIVGKAYYEGKVDIKEVIACLQKG